MNPLSPETLEMARKNQAAILQAMLRHGQKPLAEALGVSESRISRMKGTDDKDRSEIEFLAEFLACLGLKVTGGDEFTCDRETLDATLVLLRKGFLQPDCVQRFFGTGE